MSRSTTDHYPRSQVVIRLLFIMRSRGMRMILPVLAFLSSCSMTETQRSEDSTNLAPANVETGLPQDSANGSTIGQAPVSAAAGTADLPYLAVRKTRGPALQALMTGRL